MNNLSLKPNGYDQTRKHLHLCLFCGQRILLQKDQLEVLSAVDESTLHPHKCACTHYGRSRLKLESYIKHNNNRNTSKEDYQLRQSTLMEFVEGNEAKPKAVVRMTALQSGPSTLSRE
jgi:hypothetical protein